MAATGGADASASDAAPQLYAEGVYTAAAANRASQIADWAAFASEDAGESSKEGGDEEEDAECFTELIYASHRSVAVAPGVLSRHPRPVQLYPTSKGLLTVVKLAYNRNGTGQPCIVAASDDGFLHTFSRQSAQGRVGQAPWQVTNSWSVASSPDQGQTPSPQRKTRPAAVPGKKASVAPAVSVRALGVVRQGGGVEGASSGIEVEPALSSTQHDATIIASATSDGQLQMWELSAQSGVPPKLLQRLSLGTSRAETKTEILPLDIAVASLPGNADALLMAVAGTNNKIDLWLADKGTEFRKLFSLLGHTDWVRSLDFCRVNSNGGELASLMLASGAQDNSVRLWHVAPSAGGASDNIESNTAAADDFDRLVSRIEDANADEAIATKSQAFTSAGKRWSVSLDALLAGHEHWVTGVRWAPAPLARNEQQAAALLSSSADNSVILWMPSLDMSQAVTSLSLPPFDMSMERHSHEQNVWVPVQRSGELGNTGSAANGMYGAVWHPMSGRAGKSRQGVVGHGYGGAIHLWSREVIQDNAQPWQARPGRGGHFAPANALRWEPAGDYLISGGSDKTTRLHAPCRDATGSSWHEMARPQTHGYEVVGLGWLTRLAFASAGDEKIIRVFEAPKGFVQTAQSLGAAKDAQRSNTLVIRINSIEDLARPLRYAEPIKEATRKTFGKGRLDVLVLSPLFNEVDSHSAPAVSFEQAEQFLKWCYAMAWGIAVEASQLLFDVDVVLRGTKEIADGLQLLGVGAAAFVVEGDAQLDEEYIGDSEIIVLPPGQDVGESLPMDTTAAIFPQREAIAMGGTFDHLHVGHKILLSIACLLATRRIVVGVTDDSMLAKKKQAHLLEPIADRIGRVSGFMSRFCALLGRQLQYDVVKLEDVAGPAGTDCDLSALLFTDETVGGAEFIDGVREKNGLARLDRFAIGVIGAAGETDVKGKDASELAAVKVGSTAIREWLAERQAKGDVQEAILALDQTPTLTGDARPIGASVPPLGLSNRAIYGAGGKEGSHTEPQDMPSASGQPVGKAVRSIATHLSRPPVEEELHNHSIWTEITKLYGHSLELLALDVDRIHGLVASSCKANQAELAGIRLHDARQGWKEVQMLMGHTLGVTSLRFSKDGQHLVSVSRDRSWRLFARQSSKERGPKQTEGDSSSSQPSGPFKEIAVQHEAHTRIIYDAAWCGQLRFVTASRDGTLKIWQLASHSAGSVQLTTSLAIREPVTAVAVDTQRLWLAAGSEKGNVFIFQQRQSGPEERTAQNWELALTLSNLHADALSELAWQPPATPDGSASGRVRNAPTLLASAGHDGAVRLTRIGA